MNIRTAEEARVWLAAWGGRPRRGVLQKATSWAWMCMMLTPRHCPEQRAAYAAALAVLEMEYWHASGDRSRDEQPYLLVTEVGEIKEDDNGAE